MGLATKFDEVSKHLRIIIEGRFDFSLQRNFRDSYENNSHGQVDKYIVDLGKTTYLDSSALGMLLVLKEYAEKNNATIKLAQPDKVVMEILSLSNFDKLFEVD